MHAAVIQSALAPIPTLGKGTPQRPAVLLVGGIEWTSETPLNAGQAETINQDAATIAAFINQN